MPRSPRSATCCSSRAPAMPASVRSSACPTRTWRRCSVSPAVIVSEGGVGRPIDEIVLNKALFERAGVTVAGAIVNKVDLGAKPELARTLERGLARHGIPLLGVLPYRPLALEPDPVHGPRGRPRRPRLCRPGPRPGHRWGVDRGDGAAPHAPAHRATGPGHRARRPRGRRRGDRPCPARSARTPAGTPSGSC